MSEILLIKAITVWQPWASLLALGIKPVENRPRRNKYRGPLLIHAGQKFDYEGYTWIIKNFPDIKHKLDAVQTPHGGFVGKVNMVDCVEKFDSPWFTGKFGYVFENAQTMDLIPYRGQQGLFNVPVSFIEADHNTEITQNRNCDKTGISSYCCNTDVKLVQLRSKATCGNSTNEFKGPTVFMCKECRRANCGCFKIIKSSRGTL